MNVRPAVLSHRADRPPPKAVRSRLGPAVLSAHRNRLVYREDPFGGRAGMRADSDRAARWSASETHAA